MDRSRLSAYFGQDAGRVAGRVAGRLLAEQLPDGGWNCEAPTTRSVHPLTPPSAYSKRCSRTNAPSGAVRRFFKPACADTSIFSNAAFSAAGSSGEVIARDRKGGSDWTRFAFPTWWHYDVLRGLEYLRSAGTAYDARMAEAIHLVESKRDGSGRWPLETRYPGVMAIEIGETEGQPSRWNTLRALRVLNWFGREPCSTACL